jgi:hypothetical protein
MAAVFTDTLVRYKKEGFKPRRDIKLALTCGEETPASFNTVRWLAQTQPQVLSAAFALNEGAGGDLDANGKPVSLQIQAGEKVYQDFELEATDVATAPGPPRIIPSCDSARDWRAWVRTIFPSPSIKRHADTLKHRPN